MLKDIVTSNYTGVLEMASGTQHECCCIALYGSNGVIVVRDYQFGLVCGNVDLLNLSNMAEFGEVAQYFCPSFSLHAVCFSPCSLLQFWS